jgi:hypothetical protein
MESLSVNLSGTPAKLETLSPPWLKLKRSVAIGLSSVCVLSARQQLVSADTPNDDSGLAIHYRRLVT